MWLLDAKWLLSDVKKGLPYTEISILYQWMIIRSNSNTNTNGSMQKPNNDKMETNIIDYD